MKKTAVFFLVFIFLFALPVNAVTVNEHSVVFNEEDSDFTVYTIENLSEHTGLIFGMTQDDFTEYMETNNLVLYGSDSESSVVFNLSCVKTSFSEEISDFSDMEDETVLSFADDFVSEVDGILLSDGVKYIITTSAVTQKASTFSTTQYITVRNGKLYVLTVNISNMGSKTASEITNDILERLKIQKDPIQKSLSSIITVVLLIVLIIIVAIITVTVSVSIIKDLKRKQRT